MRRYFVVRNVKSGTTENRSRVIAKGNFLAVIAVLLMIACFSGHCFADDINFDVNINRTKIPLGSSAQLSLNYHGTQNVSAPDLPEMEGFDSRYIGPSTRMSIVNGRIATSITHIYNLNAVKVGTFKIPSISVEYDGETYTSKAITVEVTRGEIAQPYPAASHKADSQSDIQGLSDRLFLIMQVGEKKAYINQIIPVSIKLFMHKLAVRDMQYPVFPHEGFLVDEFDAPKQYKTVLNGLLYDVIEFNTNIFGMRPGELTLGPTELKCSLVLKRGLGRRSSSIFDDDFFNSDIFGDFFGHYEKRSLTLESIAFPIKIMALPEEGKPADFEGALGDYRFDIDVSHKEVKVGDPITLTMTVSGDGNFKTVKTPHLDLNEYDFKVYEPEVEQDSRSKRFEQVIIPKDENIDEIPRVVFSFFDTEAEEYKTITKGPIPIRVNPLLKGEELKVFELPEDIPGITKKREILGRDIIFIKEGRGRLRRRGEFLYKNKLFIYSLLLPLVAIFSVLTIQARRQRLETDIGYARRLRAPRKARKNLAEVRKLLATGEPDRFFKAVFNALQEYLGDKFHLPTAGITSSVVEDPKLADIDKEISDNLRACFHICDRARYAPSSIRKEEMSDTFDLLRKTIDRLERPKI